MKRIFIRDDSGEAAAYCGSEREEVKQSLFHYLDAAVHDLLNGSSEGPEEFQLEVVEMTDEEVAALPDGVCGIYVQNDT